jgi:hypothetical protein
MNKGVGGALLFAFITVALSLPARAREVTSMPVVINQKLTESFQVEVSHTEAKEKILISSSQLKTAIHRINRAVPASLDELKTEQVSLDELKELGFFCRYDEVKVEIEINLPVDRLNPEKIQVAQAFNAENEGKTLEAADISGYVNTSATAGFRRDQTSVAYGDPVAARFDGVLNVKGYILEAAGTAKDSSPFFRDDIRITKEIDTFEGARVSVGDLYYPVKGFQSYRKIGGVGIYTIREQSQGSLSNKASNRLLEVKQVSLLTFFVNEHPVATRKVVPGVYDITEVPMVSGVNTIRVLIEAEGSGEKESVIFNDFMSDYGIKEGQRDFAVAIGSKSTDGLTYRSYETENKTVMFSHRYDFTNKYSASEYYQGDSSYQLYGLIQAFHVPGGYIEIDAATSSQAPNSGQAVRFGYFKTSLDEVYLLKGDRFSVNFERKFLGFSDIDSTPTEGTSAVFGAYSLPSWKGLATSFGASFARAEVSKENLYSYSSTLSRTFGNFNVSFSGTQQYRTSLPNEFSVGLNVNWSPDEHSYYLNTSKTGKDQTTTYVAINTTKDQDVKGGITTSSGASDRTISTQVTGSTNRNEMTFTGTRIDSNGGAQSFAEHFALNTRFSLAFAGTNFAIGRPISDSFFITNSVRENRKYKVESWGRYSETGPMGEAILGFQNYNSNSAKVSSGEIFGRDFDSNGVFNVTKSYKAGYLLNLTEKITPTVLAFSVDNLEDIIERVATLKNLKTGEVTDLFVSSEGEVFIENIDVGDYKFEVGRFQGLITLNQQGGRRVFSLKK